MTEHLVSYQDFNKQQAGKLIRRYDVDVRDADQDIIFADFARADGQGLCRIIIATVSLGMGMTPFGRRAVRHSRHSARRWCPKSLDREQRRGLYLLYI